MTISELRAALSAVTEMDGALRHAQGGSDVSAIPQPQGTNGETAPSDQDKPADV
jgi:hypothetical protein